MVERETRGRGESGALPSRPLQPDRRVPRAPTIISLSLGRGSALREGPTHEGQGHGGGVGGLYYIYEALSKQSNNIDSAPRSDRPSQRTPSHGPPFARVYTLPEGSRRPYSFRSLDSGTEGGRGGDSFSLSPLAECDRIAAHCPSPPAAPRELRAVFVGPPRALLLLFRCAEYLLR